MNTYGFDLEKIQVLLKDFYHLTNMKTCIHDSNGVELCFYPKKLSDFCELLRKNKEMDERCQQCDKFAFAECKRTGKQYVYTCHAGLLECISPILFDEKVIGYIAYGQVKTHAEANFNSLAYPFSVQEQKALKKAFDGLPIIEHEKLEAAIRILDACTGYEYLKGLSSVAERTIDDRIDTYISERLTEDLSVQTLCSHFHLAHNEIYSIFKGYFQTTPAEYIKQKRLHAACELLKRTNLPINKIAIKCGIPDYNYFSKIFKQTFKIPPSAYRKKYKTLIK